MTILDPEPIEIKVNQIWQNKDQLTHTELAFVEDFLDMPEDEWIQEVRDQIEAIWARIF